MDDCGVITGSGRINADDVDEWYPMRFEVRVGMLCVFATVDNNSGVDVPPLRIEPGVSWGSMFLRNLLRCFRSRPYICHPDDFIVDSVKNTIDIQPVHPLRWVMEVEPGGVAVDEIKELWLQEKRKD